MKKDFFGDELALTYRVRSLELAELQNFIDITAWRMNGLISPDEEEELKKLNTKLARTYRYPKRPPGRPPGIASRR